MFYPKKKHGFLKLSLILIFSAALGMFIGYASVRYENLPFFDNFKIKQQENQAQEPVEIPTYTPIYTNAAKNNEIEVTPEPSPEPTPEPDYDYTVKADGSKVYLYKIAPDGKMSVEQTLPINLNALKDEDKKLLTGGISVKSKQELAGVLEDFGS